MALREFTAAPGYTVRWPNSALPCDFEHYLSHGEAVQVAQQGPGTVVVERDANPRGLWGEHTVCVYHNGVKVFPFPLPDP